MIHVKSLLCNLVSLIYKNFPLQLGNIPFETGLSEENIKYNDVVGVNGT